jgi:hypothetical protein
MQSSSKAVAWLFLLLMSFDNSWATCLVEFAVTLSSD